MARTLNVSDSLHKIARALRDEADRLRSTAASSITKAKSAEQMADQMDAYALGESVKKTATSIVRTVAKRLGLTKSGKPDRRYKRHRSGSRKMKVVRKKRL